MSGRPSGIRVPPLPPLKRGSMFLESAFWLKGSCASLSFFFCLGPPAPWRGHGFGSSAFRPWALAAPSAPSGLVGRFGLSQFSLFSSTALALVASALFLSASPGLESWALPGLSSLARFGLYCLSLSVAISARRGRASGLHREGEALQEGCSSSSAPVGWHAHLEKCTQYIRLDRTYTESYLRCLMWHTLEMPVHHISRIVRPFDVLTPPGLRPGGSSPRGGTERDVVPIPPTGAALCVNRWVERAATERSVPLWRFPWALGPGGSSAEAKGVARRVSCGRSNPRSSMEPDQLPSGGRRPPGVLKSRGASPPRSPKFGVGSPRARTPASGADPLIRARWDSTPPRQGDPA